MAAVANSSSLFPATTCVRTKRYAQRNKELFHCIKCVKKDGQFDPSSIEPPPYYSYMDSASGQFEPASGARASILVKEYWPEGMFSRVRAASAPGPVCKSEGKPSYGRNPGSRRKKYKGQGAASDIAETTDDYSDQTVLDNSDDILEEPKDPFEEFVIYKAEAEEENLTSYELDKRLGRPHPFIDPTVVKPIEEP